MFYFINIATNISLCVCIFIYGSEFFLNATEFEFNTNGWIGEIFPMALIKRDIERDIVIGSISSFTFKLINSALKGKINYSNIDDTLDITLDSDSKIILTGNSYYTSLYNSVFLYQFW